MKISIINAIYGRGSTGVIVKDLQEFCMQSSIEAEIVYTQPYDLKLPYTFHMGNTLSNKLHALFSRVSGKQGYFSFLSTMKLIKHYDEFRPDIIHLHNLHNNYINLPMILKYIAKKNITLIITLHDCWFYTGGCTHYTSVDCFKWKDSCGTCPKRKGEVKALLFDGTSETLKDRYELFDKINHKYAIGVSQWIVNEAKQTVFKTAICDSIHNGIDTKFFHPTESAIRESLGIEDKFVILAPSNKWFLEVNRHTFDYFASRLTDDMCMVFIGNGCDDSRLTNKMINYGFVSSREEIRDVYSMADVLLNCTREESLSLLNVEVQACGTPVVTYSNTGVKETVDGKCGFAVENGNPDEMWHAMMKIKELNKTHYSANCISWVNKVFERHKNCMKYINLYNSIVSPGNYK